MKKQKGGCVVPRGIFCTTPFVVVVAAARAACNLKSSHKGRFLISGIFSCQRSRFVFWDVVIQPLVSPLPGSRGLRLLGRVNKGPTDTLRGL